MWVYMKTLQHEINLKSKDLKMAKYLITQYGGCNGSAKSSSTTV
ncbi:Protein cotJC [human gut metagenome]|uniref:Protein cotJC n=1 Tax=human gut metagenome TaxID=408170 RepID=W1XUL1_9ZZZZ